MNGQRLRSRAPHRGWSTARDRRARSQVTALVLVAAGAVLGWGLPVWERHLPAQGLGFDASTAQATLAAIAGGMITLAGFVVTAITLVVQTVLNMSPRLVGPSGTFPATSSSSDSSWAPPCTRWSPSATSEGTACHG